MSVPPPPPTSPTSIVSGQTASTTSATVTVQWGASTGADSYTVSITPAIFEPVTVAGTMTSLVLDNVPYSTTQNTTYTVSIVARNCAGSSAAESVTFTIVPCVVSDTPLNGEWLQFSPSETVGPGTSLSLSCNAGYEPSVSEVMASSCQSDGSWEPDTAQLECVAVDCGPPTLASGVVVLEASVSSTFNYSFSFRCEEGLFPTTTFEAVCGADGQWSLDPANHICRDESTDSPIGGSKLELSTGGAVAITAVLCSVVFFILGTMFGILTYYCITAKRAQYSVSNSSTEPQTPAPVYEEVTATDGHPKAIELSKNIAYGPASH